MLEGIEQTRTFDNWSDMEISRAVVEQVLNGCWHKSEPVDKRALRTLTANYQMKCGVCESTLPPNYDNPNYCRSDKRAQELVQGSKSRWKTKNGNGHYWVFTDCSEYGWRAEIWYGHHDGNVLEYWTTDKTLNRAICKAVLAYNGVIGKG